MDDRECCKIKPGCLMRDRTRKASGCPAYRSGRNCWEFDWRMELEHSPASQREYWFLHLKECPACDVYNHHPDEMQARIDEVVESYLEQ